MPLTYINTEYWKKFQIVVHSILRNGQIWYNNLQDLIKFTNFLSSKPVWTYKHYQFMSLLDCGLCRSSSLNISQWPKQHGMKLLQSMVKLSRNVCPFVWCDSIQTESSLTTGQYLPNENETSVLVQNFSFSILF